MSDLVRFDRIENFLIVNQRIVVAGLIGFSLLMGTLYSLSLGDIVRYADEGEYLRIATNIVEKSGFILWEKPTAFRPPAYPYFLSFLLWTGLKIIHLRIVHFLLLGITGLLVFQILKKRTSLFAAMLGMAVVLFYPLSFYTAGTFYPQTLATTILALAVYSYFRDENPQMINIVVTGICLGILVLITPSFVFTLFFFIVWILWNRRSVGKKVGSIVVLGVASLLIFGPWIVRNYRVFDTFVFVSTNGGMNLLIGNCEHTTAKSGVVDISKYKEEADTHRLNEVERDRYYRQEALDNIREQPLRYAGLYALKLLNYFHFQNTLATQREASWWKTVLAIITYVPLLMFGIILRFVYMRKVPLTRFDRFILLLYIFNGAFSAIFFTRLRFRVPFDVLLICVAVLFMERYLLTRKSV